MRSLKSRPLFRYFRFFQIIQNKSVDFSEIRTRIVGVEGKHADHLTITTTLHGPLFWYYLALYYLQTCFSLSEATFDGTQQSG